MANPYYPTNDQEFEAWLASPMLANLPAVMTALGLPATFDDALVAAKATYTTELADHVAAQAASFNARQIKDDAKNAAIDALRKVVTQLRANPAFTDAMATSIGLPVYDTTPTPVAPGGEVPSIAVDTSHPQRHTISFWQSSDAGEEATAKPEWARAARIMHAIVATGSPPPAIENMAFLATDTATPYTWDIPGAHVGKDIWYRAAWETTRGELGPWSDPAKGTVTG